MSGAVTLVREVLQPVNPANMMLARIAGIIIMFRMILAFMEVLLLNGQDCLS
jgi:hypothetical protein